MVAGRARGGGENASGDEPAPAIERYRQGLPVIDLYIERGTERVPGDGRFYIVYQGAVVAGFRGLKAAQRCYQERQRAIGYVPPPVQTPSADERLRNEDLERDLLRSASYWAESHRHGSGGGKLRHR